MSASFHRGWLLLACLTLAQCIELSPCLAHPDLIEQIVKVTKQLDGQRGSAGLFLQRADLFRRHGQFDAALMDIETAEGLQTNAGRLTLDRARVLSDAGRTAEALENIQNFLQANPGEAEALLIRARSEARLGNAEAAVLDYNAGIARCPAPGPDLFLERARQQAKLGKLADAVRGLDEAITNSTPASPLQLTAIEYERQRGAFDSALRRVDKIVAQYPVKEPWLTLRAEVLEQAGRTNEALATFRQVLTGIENYSTLRRNLDLSKQLEHRVRQGLARTGTPPPASSKS